jgi:hypothetical protein
MTKKWDKEISPEARETVRLLGHFQPTTIPENKEIKGWIEGEGKVYFNSEDLSKMAAHFIEIASWLDNRANDAVGKKK